MDPEPPFRGVCTSWETVGLRDEGPWWMALGILPRLCRPSAAQVWRVTAEAACGPGAGAKRGCIGGKLWWCLVRKAGGLISLPGLREKDEKGRVAEESGAIAPHPTPPLEGDLPELAPHCGTSIFGGIPRLLLGLCCSSSLRTSPYPTPVPPGHINLWADLSLELALTPLTVARGRALPLPALLKRDLVGRGCLSREREGVLAHGDTHSL